ncbi:MAG: hypothetical protein PHF51_00770 [Candidatus ainarchaeum sp.]|nr:hypothetical protein [Candidatus ainarchaeum sp.]
MVLMKEKTVGPEGRAGQAKPRSLKSVPELLGEIDFAFTLMGRLADPGQASCLSGKERAFLRRVRPSGRPLPGLEADCCGRFACDAIRHVARSVPRAPEAGEAVKLFSSIAGRPAAHPLQLDVAKAAAEGIKCIGANTNSPGAWKLAVEFLSSRGARDGLRRLALESDYDTAKEGVNSMLSGNESVPPEVASALIARTNWMNDAEFGLMLRNSQLKGKRMD